MVEFLYLVAKDSLNLRGKKINLKKLVGNLKETKEFELNGDPSTTIDIFQAVHIKNQQAYFFLNYKGAIRYLKISSIDFFLSANEFKKSFFKKYVKNCLE